MPTAAKKSKKVFATRDVTRYAKVCALHNKLEKMRTGLRQEFVEGFEKGYATPTDGPFIVVEEFQSRVDQEQWSWKMFAMQLAIELYGGDVQKGMERVVKAELEAPRHDVPVIKAKANPEFGKLRGIA